MKDIHCHVLNEVDDGSVSLDESLELLESASGEGITDIICTPHYMKFGNYRTSREIIDNKFNKLKEIAEEKYKINLYIGNEVLYEKRSLVEYIENGLIHTLNNGRYILFEMSFVNFSRDIYEEIYDLNACGYKPILAHPERYAYVQENPNIVYKLVKEGCLIQVNQDSLLGRNGKTAKETAVLLLKHNLVHFVASDGHGVNRRVTMKKAYDFLEDVISEEYREDLFANNAEKVISNEVIELPSFTKIEKVRYFGGLFSKLK